MKDIANKVIVIGLDGVTWELIKPWADKGWLPNIRKIMQKGAWGTLISTTPPITGPAWVTIATGKNPGSHGCYNFVVPTDSLLSIEPIDTTKIKGRTFYELLEKDGKKCILINLPCSFPPRIKKGILLPSFLDTDSEQIYSKDLTEKIPEIKDYRVMPDFLKTRVGRGEGMAKDARDLEAVKFSIAQKLFKSYEWDFFFVLFGMTDWIQHKCYKDILSGKEKKGSVFVQCFLDLDRYIGWFLKRMGKKTTLVLMSDHGFKSVSTYFHVNVWLKDKGLLRQRLAKFHTRASMPLTPKRLLKGNVKGVIPHIVQFISTVLVSNSTMYLFSGHAARFIAQYIPLAKRIIPSELYNVGYEIDPEHTVAYSIAGNVTGIYINDTRRFKDGIVPPGQYEKTREKIIRMLKNLTDANGKKVFSHVYKKEDVYSGDYLLMAPDIVYEESGHIVMTTLLSSTKAIEPTKDGGWHAKKGIIAAYGDTVQKGKHIKDSSLLDLAPTILHLFGRHIPIDMEGKILFDLFKKNK